MKAQQAAQQEKASQVQKEQDAQAADQAYQQKEQCSKVSEAQATDSRQNMWTCNMERIA